MKDEPIPTFPIVLAKKVHVSAAATSVVVGTVRIPKNKVGQLTVQKLFTSSADTWFRTTTVVGGVTGTVDYEYLEAPGGMELVGDIHKPLASFPGGETGGTVRVVVESPGSATDYAAVYQIHIV